MESPGLANRLGRLRHHSRQQLLFLELLGEISLGAFYARVHLHVERFARRVSVRRKAEGVLPWNGHGAPGRTRRVAGNGGDGIFRARRARRRVAQIPYPAVHARSARKSFGDANPIARDQLLDRKSTRLNSSHVSISYAVFCLKKKRERRLMGVCS